MRVRLIVLCFITLVPFINTALGQSANGTVSGIVLDPSGGVIAGADVLIVNDATAVQYPGKTNSEGYYIVPNIPPGTYRIQVSNSGFKTIIKPDIVIHVEDALAINFTLPIGAASEVVTVQGGAAVMNTENASVGTVIDRQFVENIPLNGQSFNTLLQLTPGTVIVPSNSSSPGQFSINGQRTDGNLFEVDGVSANFGTNTFNGVGQAGGGGMQGFNAYGGTASLVSVDAMQEFRVETSSFSPEFGRTPGGQVSITTRSGTNQLHGDVFDYFRNTVLDANDWFANAAGLPRAPERQNDFGGVIGGPIVKDRTFFFFSYEGLRLRQPQTEQIEVPSVTFRQGAIPAAAAILNAYPRPNGPVSSDGFAAQFTGNYSNQITMNATSLRMDQVVNSHLTLFGRFNYSPSQIKTRVDSLSTTQDSPTNTTTVTLGLTAQLTTNTTNALRFNYSKQDVATTYALDSLGGAIPISATALLPEPYSLTDSNPYFSPILDGIAPLQMGANARDRVTQWNVVDGVSLLEGSHELKFGFDYNRLLLTRGGQAFSPQYYPFDAQQFESTATVGFIQTLIFNHANVLFNELSVYAQDRWKMGPRFTLTYGLRWELDPAPSGQNTILASWENVNDPANTTLAPPGTPPWKTTYSNFAPRLGFAYRLSPNGDLILRGGTGIFYDLGTGISASLAGLFPNDLSFVGFPGPFPVPLTNPASVTPVFSLSPPFPNQPIVGIDPNLKLPYSYQWNIALEKSFWGDNSLSITYLGQIGRRLLRTGLNEATNPDFTSGFFLTNNGDTSNYNALQIQYKKRMSRGIQALIDYTWSHSIDTNSDDGNGAISEPFVSVAGERGSSNFDVRQNFTGAFVYTPPNFKKNDVLRNVSEGWALSGFVLARTGFPINIFTFDVPVTGGFGAESRPDLVPGQPIWLNEAQCLEAPPVGFGRPCPGGKGLNPNAFALPSTPRQGTLPRNYIYGFGATQFDTSLQRNFNITERVRLLFRTDVFNLFNHPNFSSGFPFGYFGTPQFGIATQMLNQGLSSSGAGLNALYNIGGPRSLQLSLKLFF